MSESLQLVEPKIVSETLGVTVETLSLWRCTGRVNLPYVKVGRKVMYRPEEVQAFIDRNTQKIPA